MKTKSIPPVLVIRGNDICFYGIISSLHRNSIPFISIVYTWPSASRWYSESYLNFAEKVIEIKNPFDASESAAMKLEQAIKELFQVYEQRLLIIPSTDTNQSFIVDHYDRFSQYVYMMGSDLFLSEPGYMIDKGTFTEFGLEHFPSLIPNSVVVRDLEGVDDKNIDTLDFPVVYKPTTKDYGQSFYKKHGGLKAIELNNAECLRSMLIDELKDGFELIVQEKIQFESNYDEIPFYLYANGNHEIEVAATGYKHTIEPYPYGTAIVLDLTWVPELLPAAQMMVQAMKWCGLLMIKFIFDKKDSTWKVIEINTRPWLLNGFYAENLPFYDFLSKPYIQASTGVVKEIITPAVLETSLPVRHVILTELCKTIDAFGVEHYLSLKERLINLRETSQKMTATYFTTQSQNIAESILQDLSLQYNWPATAAVELWSILSPKED